MTNIDRSTEEPSCAADLNIELKNVVRAGGTIRVPASYSKNFIDTATVIAIGALIVIGPPVSVAYMASKGQGFPLTALVVVSQVFALLALVRRQRRP